MLSLKKKEHLLIPHKTSVSWKLAVTYEFVNILYIILIFKVSKNIDSPCQHKIEATFDKMETYKYKSFPFRF